MQQPIQKKSNTLGIVLVAVILAVIAYFYFTNKNTEDALLETQTRRSDEIIGKELLAALNRLNSLRLDDSIFRQPTFNGLEDFTVEIVEQPIGRPNPFLPVGKTTSAADAAALKKAIPPKR